MKALNASWVLSVAALSLFTACGDSGSSGGGGSGGEGGSGGSGGDGGSAPVTVDDSELGAQAADVASLTKVNVEPFMSAQHMGNPMVNVYVNDVAADSYAEVTTGSPVTFPEGSMIVKEMLDPEGTPMMLTAMFKADAGYDSDNNDWWWGMLTLDGQPAESGSVGKIAMCNGCHQAQTTTDATFGLPN